MTIDSIRVNGFGGLSRDNYIDSAMRILSQENDKPKAPRKRFWLWADSDYIFIENYPENIQPEDEENGIVDNIYYEHYTWSNYSCSYELENGGDLLLETEYEQLTEKDIIEKVLEMIFAEPETVMYRIVKDREVPEKIR